MASFQTRRGRLIPLRRSFISDRVRNGKTQAKVSKEMGVAEGTLRGWLKDKGKLLEACTVMDDCGQKRKRSRTAQDRQLE